jgi:hypothetical protein
MPFAPPQQDQRVEDRPSWWHRQSARTRNALIAVGIIVGITTAALIARTNQKDDSPTHTPTEAACIMLGQGDTPDEAYRAMKLLVPKSDARSAVDRAVAQGC